MADGLTHPAPGPPRKPGTFRRGLMVAAATLVLLGGLLVVVPPSPSLLNLWHSALLGPKNLRMRLPFDSAGWKAGKPDGGGVMWPARLRMADDLTGSGRLRGLTRAQVIGLLGGEGGSGRLEYYLGPWRGFPGLDSEYLMIDFGPGGRVSRWWIEVEEREVYR